jgi:hypothetical protein
MSGKYKRRRLWVDPPFQWRLMWGVVVYLVVYSVVVFHFGLLFEVVQAVTGGHTSGGFSAIYVGYLHKQWPLMITFVVTTPLLLYDLLKLSNRVAGPLYRCRRVMREMAAGKAVEGFAPRKHDLMRDFFEAFNALIQAWNARTGAAAGEAGPPVCPSEAGGPTATRAWVGAPEGSSPQTAVTPTELMAPPAG